MDEMPNQHVQAYKDATDNLLYLKKEQLQLTYYTWLLLAALYVLSGKASPNARAFLEVGTGVVGLFSVLMLWGFQTSMKRLRSRLRTLYDRYFDKDEQISL